MSFIVESQPHRSEPSRLRSRSRQTGFTLLELIGVLVVIAILAAAVLPSTIDLIQVQRSVNERAELPKIAEALKRGILREQSFPAYQNAATVATDGDATFWWNLAARHGGGSANTVRYPLGVRPGSNNTRKLYFAKPNWAGKSFFEITGDGAGWLSNPQDPRELRLLLVSTSGSELPLPDTLTGNQFDALWDNWAIGNDGNPAVGIWANYGLSSAVWKGRAPELNVQRIDLRDWLSIVVIENRRAISEESGRSFDNSDVSSGSLLGDWVSGSVYAYTENVVGAEVILQTRDVSVGSAPASIITRVDGVVLTKRGRVTDESAAVTIVIGGSEVTTAPGPPIVTTTASAEVRIPLTLTDRAPIALLNPNFASGGVSSAGLNGWGINDDYKQTRYFLPRQELLLGEPWPTPDNPDEYPEVGIFTIDKPFSTLRFDGLRWQY